MKLYEFKTELANSGHTVFNLKSILHDFFPIPFKYVHSFPPEEWTMKGFYS